jgi:hypothetical protein
MAKKEIEFRDPIVERVVEKFVSRSDVGFEKYGHTLHDERTKKMKGLSKYLNDVQEELMDAILYIQACREEIQDLTEEALIKDCGHTDFCDCGSEITVLEDDVSSTTIGNMVVNYELVDVKKERYGNRN